MKKLKFLFITLAILSSHLVNSQEIFSNQGAVKREFKWTKMMIIDTCTISIQYSMSCVENLKMPEKKTNFFMLLQIGKHISKFSDYFMLKSDSLAAIYEKQKMDEIEALNKIIKIQKGTTPINIFKNYPVGKISTCDYMPMGGSYKYTEERIKPTWKLEAKDSSVCGYNCKKATTAFRGRNYTAWYTEQIPISDGPWKFWGLPGLILKITDDKNEYSFECVAIEKPRWTNNIYILDNDYFNTTGKRFNEGVKKFYENPGVFFESSRVKVDGKTPTTIKSRSYNPIELSE